MTTELKQAAQQAADAFDAFGEADDFASLFELTRKLRALRTAIQQAEAQQPATPSLQAVCSYISDVLAGDASSSEKHIARTIMHLLPLEQSLSGQQPATCVPVQADSSGHLRVIASLGAALRRLSFAAQTTGGTDGPDAELQSAIGQAEQALSLGGIWQAMSATTEPVEDGIRNAEDELSCAEEVLDAITCEFSDGEFPVTDFNCIGEYITAVVDVFKERLAAQQPATTEPVVSRNPFASRCYTMSESHLSGHRLIVGFEKLGDAQDAHEWVTRQGRGDFTHPATGEPGDDFDLICNAIDKADTITMEGDYMLDSDDCIAVVRVMQVLLSVRDAMLAAKKPSA